MSRTKKILNLISKLGPMTVEEVAANLGISVTMARQSIADMGQRGYVKSRPSTYSITEIGDAWRRHAPESAADRMQKTRERQRRELHVSALNSRPMLQTVWGASA